MRLPLRIALLATASFAIIFSIAILFVYADSQQFTREEFYTRLERRADIAHRVYYEKEKLTVGQYLEAKEELMHALPQEELTVYDGKDSVLLQPEGGLDEFSKGMLEVVATRNEHSAKNETRQYFAKVYPSAGGSIKVVVSAVDVYGGTKLNNLLRTLMAAFLFALTAAFAASLIVGRRAIKPVNDIIAKVQYIQAENLHERVPTGPDDNEIRELALTFNSMLERLQQTFEMQVSFVNNASHELKTPLTSILGEVEVTLGKSRTEEEYRASLLNVQEELLRMTNLVQNLLKMARASASFAMMPDEKLRLDELLWDVAAEAEKRFPGQQIRVELRNMPSDPDAMLLAGNYEWVRIAIFNLVENACKYGMNKPVELEYTYSSTDQTIRILDHGMGIPPEDISKLGGAFFRGGNVRGISGSGLGLALAYRILNMHGARVSMDSTAGAGTVFTVSFMNARRRYIS